MVTIAEAINEINFYSKSFTAFTSCDSDDHIDIHTNDGNYVTTIELYEAESFMA